MTIYYAMCEACPARRYWYTESTDKTVVDDWAAKHASHYGHVVTRGHSDTSFNPYTTEEARISEYSSDGSSDS
jgi:hypothetical protein